jgi:monooxygenase
MQTDDHLDVLIVGAGLSGIDAAYWINTASPKRSWAIFEARKAVGGTWDLFRYPGIRSDSDMATLGFPFRPWRGQKSIADGGEIRDYIAETAREFDLDGNIRFRHRVVSAEWSTADARWTVAYEVDGVAAVITCSFLYMCSGYYDYAEGHAPDWPGVAEFGGRIVHPQFWPDDFPVKGKTVIVIGSGATAVTLVPALAALGATHVTMLQRSPTYIVSRPSRDAQATKLRKRLPAGIADVAIRWKNIAYSIFVYDFARKKPNVVKQKIAAAQRHYLGPDFDMGEHFTPRYDPWDQRLCLVPDGDLFKTLRGGDASIVTDQIECFTSSGVRLKSGKELPADLVVTATGLKVKMMGGATLKVDGQVIDPGSRLLYKGAMLDGVPNFAFAVGYTNASWTLKCDLTSRFVSQLVNYMADRKLSIARPVAPVEARSNEGMLALTSGYVERAASLLPRQGAKAPWKVHQNYLKDLAAFRFARINDGVLRFEKLSKKGMRKEI